jgi:hypothetical protein
MPDCQDLSDLDDRAQAQTATAGPNQPDEAEGYSFVLDDAE